MGGGNQAKRVKHTDLSQTGKTNRAASTMHVRRSARQQQLMQARTSTPYQPISSRQDNVDWDAVNQMFDEVDAEVEEEEDLRERDDDGLDWMPHDPSRPAAPANLWAQVYTPLTPVTAGNNNAIPNGAAFSIPCQEGCGKQIYLNGKYQELNATGTPHGKLRKPPICHIVSWAVLKVVKDEKETIAGKRHTDAFLKRYCWQLANMRPGHNGCNGTGTKSKSDFYSAQEKKQAEALYDKAVKAAGNIPVFQ